MEEVLGDDGCERLVGLSRSRGIGQPRPGGNALGLVGLRVCTVGV